MPPPFYSNNSYSLILRRIGCPSSTTTVKKMKPGVHSPKLPVPSTSAEAKVASCVTGA